MTEEQGVPASARAPDRYLREPEVLKRVGVSWVTLRRWEQQGRFPKRHKIGPRVVAWPESEINNWMATNAASSNQKEAS
jgi:prophage regulatory protein